jgi:hypothetical protein
MTERQIEADGPGRRWISGQHGAPPGGAERLLRHARDGRACRWSSAGRALGAGRDQIDAERLIHALVDAGLAQIHERLSRRGDWEPYEWRLTAAAREQGDEDPLAGEIAAYQGERDPDQHPVLQACRAWLDSEEPTRSPTAARLVMAIGAELRRGRAPRGRLLSLQVGGHTKAVRIEDHRAAIEAATGLPLEQIVRLHGQAVLVSGPLSFRIHGRAMDAAWSVPWLALTPETVADMTDLHAGGAARLITVENLTAFEEEARRASATEALIVYTGGFPSSLEMSLITRLAALGFRRALHWGDLDPGGLRIFRYLRDALPIPLDAWRMEPELLEQLHTHALTARDRETLEAWLRDPAAPLKPLARAMLERDAKAEQEGWFLGSVRAR